MKTQVLTENGLNIYDQELKKYIQQLKFAKTADRIYKMI